MNCHEVRKILPLEPLEVSRAERASVLTHLETCKACYDYATRHSRKSSMTAQEIKDLYCEDSKDPEFRKVARKNW